MASDIEEAVKHEDWVRARRLIQKELRKNPENHWLLARLSTTYYEQRNYVRALTYARKAQEANPRCPLVLWDVAGSCNMLNRTREAVDLYRRLIRRGVESIADGKCGEGRAWARGLIADCWYRLACIQLEEGRRAHGINSLRKHLQMRGPGCRSIYPIRDVRRMLREQLSQ